MEDNYEMAMDYLKDQAEKLEFEEKPVNVPGKYVRDLVEAANNVVFEFLNTEFKTVKDVVGLEFFKANGYWDKINWGAVELAFQKTQVSVEKLENLKKACENIPL